MCESVICNACCSVDTAMEDNFWLLLGFLMVPATFCETHVPSVFLHFQCCW